MRIIIARHGVAEDSTGNDEQRRLTQEGWKQAELLGKLIRATLPPPEEIWSSPLVRCMETAEHAAKAMGFDRGVVTVPELAPGADPDQVSYLCAASKKGSLMLVGHAPDVGLLSGRLLGFKTEHRLSKGAVCIVEIDDPIHPPGRSVATLESKQYAAILRGEVYVPWTKSRLVTSSPSPGM